MTSLREMQVEIKQYFLGKSNEDLLPKETYAKLSIYKSLSFNAISSLLQNLYPLTRKVLRARDDWSEEKWREIALEYFENYPSKSAVLNQAAKDFSLYWSNRGEDFLAELAYYEWLQLEIRIMPEPVHQVLPAHRVAHFSYPIARIATQLKANQEPEVTKQNQSLYIYRDKNLRVQSFVLSPLAAYVVNRLSTMHSLDTQELEQIYSEIQNIAGLQDCKAQFEQLITQLVAAKVFS